MKERICLTLEKETLKQIDEAAGLIPRSRFVEDVLKKSLSKEGS